MELIIAKGWFIVWTIALFGAAEIPQYCVMLAKGRRLPRYALTLQLAYAASWAFIFIFWFN